MSSVSRPLAIESVVISEVSKDRITSAMAKSGAQFYSVDLLVTNNSNAPLDAAESLTQIFYDRDLRTLRLTFGDHDSRDDRPLELRYAVRQKTIEPGQDATTSHQVAFPIRFVGDPIAGMHEAYEVRFDDVDVIECTVEYQVPVKSAGTPRRASATWTKPSGSSQIHHP